MFIVVCISASILFGIAWTILSPMIFGSSLEAELRSWGCDYHYDSIGRSGAASLSGRGNLSKPIELAVSSRLSIDRMYIRNAHVDDALMSSMSHIPDLSFVYIESSKVDVVQTTLPHVSSLEVLSSNLDLRFLKSFPNVEYVGFDKRDLSPLTSSALNGAPTVVALNVFSVDNIDDDLVDLLLSLKHIECIGFPCFDLVGFDDPLVEKLNRHFEIGINGKWRTRIDKTKEDKGNGE